MNRLPHRKSIPILAILALCVTTFLAFANPVLAQEPPATPAAEATEAPTSEPSATATAAATPGSETVPLLKSTEFFRIVLTVLLVALLMWGILFLYTYSIHTSYYATTLDLAKKGWGTTPSVTAIGAFEGPSKLDRGELKIEGPAIVNVGAKSGEYKISSDTELAEIKWSVEPSNAAAILDPDKPATKVIAAMNGAFTLKADVKVSADDPEPQHGSLAVAAIVPSEGTKIDLPVFGRSYGTIAIAIVVLALVLILGLGTLLPEGSIATLLGALLAYIFSRPAPNAPAGNGSANPPAAEE